MDITFKIDVEAGVVYTVGRGNVSFEEIQEFRSKLASHPDFNKEFFHLVDYREVTMERSTDQAMSSARSRLFAKLAIVVGEMSYGFARMFYGWSEEGAVMVFKDMPSAREWLGLPPEEE